MHGSINVKYCGCCYIPPAVTLTNCASCQHSEFLCVLYGTDSKMWLFPWTA